jgi:DNA (cytosine-5)-methyltransferase 1
MSLGFEQAGFDVLAAVEYDPVHAAAHQFNFPLTQTLCRDLRRLKSSDIVEAVKLGWDLHGRSGAWDGTIDAIIGGPSCQGFSVIGRNTKDDERNKLLLDFVRMVEELSPRSFCFENVPGMLQEKFTGLRMHAISRLKAAGYRITGDQETLNAKDFGVPQNRQRVIVMGVRGENPHSLAPTHESPLTVRDAFEGLADPTSYDELYDSDAVRLRPEDTLLRRSVIGSYARVLSGLDEDANDKSHARTWQHLHLTNSLLTRHTKTSVQRFRDAIPGTAEPISHYFRLSMDAPSRTLRAGTGRERGAFSAPRPIHPIQPRVITAREAARLHSFPDWFRFNVTNWHGHRQIGNSVPPLLARAVGIQIAKSLSLKPSRSKVVLPAQDHSLLSVSMGQAKEVVMSELPPNRKRRPSSAVTDSEAKPASA